MTSKTFKSEHGRSLTIEPSDGHNLGLATTGRYLALKLEDAPALALAVLEAAGVTETDSPYMQEAADNLRAYILIEEKVTAEARERAELEAEAEALYRVYFETAEIDYKNWEKLEQRVKDYWLAVARRAREMRAEK